MEIKLVKGTHDIFGSEIECYQYIEKKFISLVEKYNYHEFRTPILEYTNLFKRNKNDSSDMVQKQMYTFNDFKNRNLVLKPEGTPGVARCIINNKLYNNFPVKAYYISPVFRYENPKCGTYRQFIQFGVENIGLDNIYADVETIILSYKILKSIKLNNVILKINSLGDQESRKKYIETLKKFFINDIKNMCIDCQKRFELNPLRILDCKNLEDQKIIKNAPKISEYLNENSRKRFKKTQEILKKFDIPYQIDEKLVRGLDYYSHIVFEYEYITKKNINIGSVCGGGHYDELFYELGGPKISGIGFAFGMERIFNVLKEDKKIPKTKKTFDLIIMPINENNIENCLLLDEKLKKLNYKTDVFLEKKSFKSMFHKIEKNNVKYAIIIGDNEIKKNEIILKNIQTKNEKKIPIKNLKEELKKIKK